MGVADRGDQLVLKELLSRSREASRQLRAVQERMRSARVCPRCHQKTYHDELLSCSSCGYSLISDKTED